MVTAVQSADPAPVPRHMPRFARCPGTNHTLQMQPMVYKVDRLTRSLADFAKLVELFEGHGVSFVSVTQQFNTTTSMGRLTLNVLLSFAQFEREIAGERIRDKFAASRRKGMWMGGTIPLGYDVRDRKLIVNEAEAETVKLIFARYLVLGCVPKLRVDLDRKGVRSKQRILTSGRIGNPDALEPQIQLPIIGRLRCNSPSAGRCRPGFDRRRHCQCD